MKTLNIGLIGNLPKPYGGVATFCYHLTSELLADGHNVSFYDTYYHAQKNCPSELKCYAAAPKIISFSSVRVFGMVFLSVFCNRKLRRFLHSLIMDLFRVGLPQVSIKMTILVILRTFGMWHFFKNKKLDIFHGQHASFDTFAILMLAKHYFERPCLVTVYVSEFTMVENHKFLSLAKYVCENSNGVMSISQYTDQQMKNTGAKPQISSVIYLGVDPSHFSMSKQIPDFLQARLRLEEEIPLILYVGWLIERKGPQILLEGLSQIEHLPWQAVFVGPDHGLGDFLSQRAEELNMAKRIVILTDVAYEALLAIYDLANIFVFPTLSRDEGFGLVALEAMAHGLPVVASKVGAIPETVVDGETGLLFPPGDFEDLAAQLKRLLSDSELRSKMGFAASQQAKESYSWGNTTEKVVSLYKSLIQNTYSNQMENT